MFLKINCKKAVVLLILCLFPMASTSPAFATNLVFPDMSGHWAEEYVNMMADELLTYRHYRLQITARKSGTSGLQFSEFNLIWPTTAALSSKLIVRMIGLL